MHEKMYAYGFKDLKMCMLFSEIWKSKFKLYGHRETRFVCLYFIIDYYYTTKLGATLQFECLHIAVV